MTRITKGLKGVFTGISSNDYHASTFHYSSSVLKDVLKKPKEVYSIMFEGRPRENKTSDAMELGSLLHTLILEPELLYDEFAFFDGASRRGKAWELFQVNNPDKILMSTSQKRTADDLMLAFNEAKVIGFDNKEIYAQQLFTQGIPEESVFTEIKGVPIKVRPDYRVCDKRKIIIDLKTTRDTPNELDEAKELTIKADYHLSAALYVQALKEETGEDYDFYWVYLSKGDKRVNVFKCSKETLTAGMDRVNLALDTILDWQVNGYSKVTKIREL